jgi:4-carboxymuconolactone decarboxylase
LQSHLFAGFPRALNAMREWRRWQAEPVRSDATAGENWREQGEATCAIVYGEMYERLRGNIRRLHPDLDDWMIVDGYGKVLSRPGLDLGRRELCIVAACAASKQDRQLHSHLHGALNAGVAPAVVSGALDAIDDLLDRDHAHSVHLLWSRVQGK